MAMVMSQPLWRRKSLGGLVEIKIRDKGTEIYRRERKDVHDIVVSTAWWVNEVDTQEWRVHRNRVTLSRTTASLPERPQLFRCPLLAQSGHPKLHRMSAFGGKADIEVKGFYFRF